MMEKTNDYVQIIDNMIDKRGDVAWLARGSKADYGDLSGVDRAGRRLASLFSRSCNSRTDPDRA